MSDPMVGASTAVFGVHLSVAVPETVTVQWETLNGTAIAGVDYEAANGAVVFAPGETEKLIEVVVYGTDVGVNNPKNFYVKLHPPTNAVLFTAFADCTITVVDDGGVPVTHLVVAQGKRGLKGDPGLSAYEQAVLMGFEGTIEEWLNEIGNTELKKLIGGFVSSDSVGLIPNSNEDQTEKLIAFFDIGGALKLKKGVYKLKGNVPNITIKSNTFLDAEGAVLDYSEATNESTGRLRTASSGVILLSTNLTADASQFEKSVSVLDATGFSVGDTVYLRANDAFSTDVVKGEVLKISNISGNTIYFNEIVQAPYLVSNVACIEKVETTKNIIINGLKMIGRGSLASTGSVGLNERAMLLSYVENVVVKNCDIVDFDRMSIHINNAYLFHIEDNKIQQPTQKVVANYNQYAICYTDCTRHGFISGNTVLQGKHGIVSSTYTGRGYAVDIDISHNTINNTWHAAIATHKTNAELSVLDNRIDGCVFGIDIRVPNSNVSRNVISNTKSRAIVLRDDFNNLRIAENVLKNGLFGIYIESGEITSNLTDIAIRDNEFSGFTNTNIELRTGAFTISMLSIKNNVFKDFNSNAISMTGNYGGYSEILLNEFYSNISNGYAVRLFGVKYVLIERNKFIDVSPIRFEPDANNVVTSHISVLENKWNKETNLISAVTGNANNLLRYKNLQLGRSYIIVPILSNAITISAGASYIIADSNTHTSISTINANAMHGDELVLTIARSVITVNSTGNIRLTSDCVMSSTTHMLRLVFNGAYWCELSRQTSST